MDFDLTWIIYSVVAMLVSSGIHEYAHAYSAYLLGDDTAKAEGRMTINPIVHIDPIGFFMMIFGRLGWSKPVPVNSYNFENRKLGNALVAIAGPFSNLLITLVVGFLFYALQYLPIPAFLLIAISEFLSAMLFVNVSLMLFNLLPIAPLDGSHIVELFIPNSMEESWDNISKYSPYLILLLFLPISPLFTFFSEIWYNLLSGVVISVLRLYGLA